MFVAFLYAESFHTGDSLTFNLLCCHSLATYVTVPNPCYLVKLSPGANLSTAAIATCSGLTAYSAVKEAEARVVELRKLKDAPIRALVVGCGGLGQWAVQLANYLLVKQYGVELYAADIRVGMTCSSPLFFSSSSSFYTLTYLLSTSDCCEMIFSEHICVLDVV